MRESQCVYAWMSRLQTEHLSTGFEDAFFVYKFVIVYV
jgi:hypothetical protein